MSYTETQVINAQINGENDAVQGIPVREDCPIYLDAYYMTRVKIQSGDLEVLQAMEAAETARALEVLGTDWDFDNF